VVNKPALIGILCLAIVASAYAIYCVTRGGQEQVLSVFAVENNIRLTMSVEKTDYRMGETINIAFEVRNDSSEALGLYHPGHLGVFVFDVHDENNVQLGSWPGEATDVFSETNIRPGETYSENLEWDQTVYVVRWGPGAHLGGAPLGPGRYYLQGWIGGSTYSILRTPSLEITLENTG